MLQSFGEGAWAFFSILFIAFALIHSVFEGRLSRAAV